LAPSSSTGGEGLIASEVRSKTAFRMTWCE
jgi:hypothetical protein